MSLSRIVCLVPSLTETLISYGLADSMVGRTRYCIEPADAVAAIETVGGTKNPNVERIVELEPTLVVVNKEENRLQDYQVLSSAGLNVYVTHPRTVAEAATMLGELGRFAGADAAGARLQRACQAALAEAREAAARRPRRSVFCPIWRNPWMTFHAGTYVGDVLRATGFANVFADHRDDDADFFAVTLDEVCTLDPQLVLLPDEPYVFTAEHAEELADAGVGRTHHLIDGKDLAWYGPRIPQALRKLSAL